MGDALSHGCICPHKKCQALALLETTHAVTVTPFQFNVTLVLHDFQRMTKRVFQFSLMESIPSGF